MYGAAMPGRENRKNWHKIEPGRIKGRVIWFGALSPGSFTRLSYDFERGSLRYAWRSVGELGIGRV
jgi:hypothetical protein